LEDLGADGTTFIRINSVGVERIHLIRGKDHACEGCNKYEPTKCDISALSSGSKYGAVAGYSEHSSGSSGSIKSQPKTQFTKQTPIQRLLIRVPAYWHVLASTGSQRCSFQAAISASFRPSAQNAYSCSPV
jgi:hypothetical protein